MNTKKWFVVLTVLVLLPLFVGCGSKKQIVKKAGDAAKKTAEVSQNVVDKTQLFVDETNKWVAKMNALAEIINNLNNNIQEQAERIEELSSRPPEVRTVEVVRIEKVPFEKEEIGPQSVLGMRIYFDFDDHKVREDQDKILAKIADEIHDNENEIIIYGHADVRGTVEYNLALGMARSLAIKEWLARDGIWPDRVTVVTYGEGNPFCIGNSEGCHAENRVVAFSYR